MQQRLEQWGAKAIFINSLQSIYHEIKPFESSVQLEYFMATINA